MKIIKRHIHLQEDPAPIELELEDAIWEILRFGGYDKSQPLNKLRNAIETDFQKGFVLHSDFYRYQRKE